jgi:transcriptional regulator with XRE-family HTH domain
MKELNKFLRNPGTKTIRRGALSRVAEYLGVSVMTVSKWYSGEWEPGLHTADQIREMISKGIDLSSRNKGRSGRKVKVK